MDRNCRSEVVNEKDGLHIIFDEQTKENLNIIVMKIDMFLTEPLSLEQRRKLIDSIIKFYFFHSDDVAELENFIDYIADFMEWFADDIERGGKCEC